MTKSWGMVDNRTISAITPVDDRTSDVRFMVYIGRRPATDSPKAEAKAREFGEEIIRQFTQDIHIWQHQRYSDPPALAGAEQQGFTAIRNWAKQFYPDGIGGSAAEVYAQKVEFRMSLTGKPIRVFQVATGNVGSEMIKRIADRPDLELIGVHCYSPEKVGKDAGELAAWRPTVSSPPERSTRSSQPNPTC